MRTYTSRGPAAHGSRRVLTSSCFTSRSSVTLCARPCTRTLQPSWSASSRWSAWKLTRPSAYTASSVSGAVRKTMVFLVTAKLTGSIMIPSAAANPTRPTPPDSSRSKHSAGLRVRKACSPTAPAFADSSSGWTPRASRLLADPIAVAIFVHLRHSRAVPFLQPCRAAAAAQWSEVPSARAIRPLPYSGGTRDLDVVLVVRRAELNSIALELHRPRLWSVGAPEQEPLALPGRRLGHR